ncbi:SWI/SNF-related matrix-associated actin-dependent regulator of chromatin subfamily E member 1 [Myotis brandtii]|uniref:SWI/SNF-related matrix-associated actin-dependent regulator of chromatin subfamily E member 1 n=1 Tax=Myotis brandtii TaxID=109478 RepID=S7N4N1_MYOBR|nr:SWI/SNF-related matrix-associated actin-dependent regulator of chromatin subfamily E member 1 [Myotis brandtii]
MCMEENQEKKIKGEDSGSALMFLNTLQHGYVVGDFSGFTFDFSIFTEELLDQSKAWEAEPLHL